MSGFFGFDVGGDEGRVDGDEEALGLGQQGSRGVVKLRGVEELAALASLVGGGEGEVLEEGAGAEVVDLEVAGHREGVEGAVELGHGLVEEGGDDAAVDVARRAFVEAGEVYGGGDGGVAGFRVGVAVEVEMEALWVGWSAGEAVAGLFVDGGG